MSTNIVIAVVVAYCACRTCCGPGAVGLTASGSRPVEGRTIAAPRWVPFGARVRVAGRWYVAEDRMSRRFEDRITYPLPRFDVYFRSHSEARKWGLRTNRVEIIAQ